MNFLRILNVCQKKTIQKKIIYDGPKCGELLDQNELTFTKVIYGAAKSKVKSDLNINVKQKVKHLD